MNENELHFFLKKNYPKEDEKCEWKEFKNLKHSVSSHSGDDIISYISGISNSGGGNLILGIEDGTLNIVGIQNFHDYTIDNIKYRVLGNLTHFDSVHFEVEEIKTSDSNKIVWIFKIPKHTFRQCVFAHKKAWQRIGEHLIEIRDEWKEAIIYENLMIEDWSKEIIEEATIDDLEENAIIKDFFHYRNMTLLMGK